MSVLKSIVIFTLCAGGLLACSSAPHSQDAGLIDVQDKPMMRHSLRELSNFDSYKMTRLVNKELNLKEKDEDAFLRNASMVLSQTVLVQPHYTEREVALRELKSKLDQEDFLVILQQAADDLIYLSKNPSPSDQATALVALDNLVIEAKTLNREELIPTLQKIANANIKISQEAKDYAEEPMARLNSPSLDAQVAIGGIHTSPSTN